VAGLSLIASWKSFGYNYIVLLGGILGIDESVIEAAKLEGIGNFKLFKDIVIPMSSATGIYVLITSIVQGLQFIFTPIKVVTQGGPNYASSNLIYQSYHEAFVYYRTGVSAALSMITMLIFAILLFLEYKYIEKGVYYEN
ncbi:carbohydrate ABC transporter permease, partial [Anaerococcus octavius]|uniref:carbohydrate ABC transporter permease n=1 Tax=Anaerococcus octavius TaxID=54007 RepID=UPI0037357D8C